LAIDFARSVYCKRIHKSVQALRLCDRQVTGEHKTGKQLISPAAEMDTRSVRVLLDENLDWRLGGGRNSCFVSITGGLLQSKEPAV